MSTSLLAPICDTVDVDILAALGQAAGLGVVEEGEEDLFAFRHALLRDAVLATLLVAERWRLAARAAGVVDALPDRDSRERVELSARLRLAAGDRRGAAEKLLELGARRARSHRSSLCRERARAGRLARGRQ